MKTKYQLIFIGSKNVFQPEILNSFFHHNDELGLDKNLVQVISERNFSTEYIGNAPTVCIYFGDTVPHFEHLDILNQLIKDATLILPVVSDIKSFSISTPNEVHNINGFELKTSEDIEPIVSCILEGLGLLRISRRLFISYKRSESSTVAIQLFEQFEKNGFDVFLDTHSIRPGEPFQEELWHRMADTDIVVLLNTPGFLTSNWTAQELAHANAMSIGILQILWPGHSAEVSSKLSIPVSLSSSDFGNLHFSDSKSYLTESIIKNIVNQAESLRARSLAARQDNLTSVFISTAHYCGAEVDLQPQKFINFKKKNGKEIVFIPTVGVPHAFTYNNSEELVKKIKSVNVEKVYLLYDHLNIRENWLTHLSWLDKHLPVNTLKILDTESWIQKNH